MSASLLPGALNIFGRDRSGRPWLSEWLKPTQASLLFAATVWHVSGTHLRNSAETISELGLLVVVPAGIEPATFRV
jgi:hypothetical protein